MNRNDSVQEGVEGADCVICGSSETKPTETGMCDDCCKLHNHMKSYLELSIEIVDRMRCRICRETHLIISGENVCDRCYDLEKHINKNLDSSLAILRLLVAGSAEDYETK